jgi:hypothetical protein
MNDLFVRRKAMCVAALSAASLLVACEDTRVKKLDTGITRDSAVSVISHDLKPGSPPDSFPNVYTRGQFLIGGKRIEVLYFTPDNEKHPYVNGKEIKGDTIPLRKLTPLVFVENRLAGRGWDFWDSVAKVNKIAVPPK